MCKYVKTFLLCVYRSLRHKWSIHKHLQLQLNDIKSEEKVFGDCCPVAVDIEYALIQWLAKCGFGAECGSSAP